MCAIIENSVFLFMVASLITSVTSMAGRVRSDFTSEHKSSLHIPINSLCVTQSNSACHLTLTSFIALVYCKSFSPSVI